MVRSIASRISGASSSRATLEFVGGHAEVRGAHPIEALRLLDERRLAVLADGVDEPARGLERGRHVGRGARHEGEQFARRRTGCAQVDGSQHGRSSLSRRSGRGVPARHTRQFGPSRLLSSP